jgi:Polymer-forming cytoskeletal
MALYATGRQGFAMSSSKHQEQLYDTPQAPARGLAPNSTKLELNNPKAPPRSLIDKLANVNGDLWSDGDIQIDGRLCGNVNCAQLIVGKDAAVIGAIIAEEAVIRGKMTGLIRATRVLLQASAAWKAKSSINHCRWTKPPASKVSRAREQPPSPRSCRLRRWPNCDSA